MNKKNILLKIVLTTALFSCILVSPAGNMVGRADAKTAVKNHVPNAYELTILVNATLAALNHANRTDNYSVLRDLSAPAFRRLNSLRQLRKIFAGHRRRQLDISAALLYSPVFTALPHIDRKNYLHLKGHIPTEPFHLKFSLIYEKSNNQWRIMSIFIAPDIKRRQTLASR